VFVSVSHVNVLFSGKVRAYQSIVSYGTPLSGLGALPTNIRLGLKSLAMTNTNYYVELKSLLKGPFYMSSELFNTVNNTVQ
jgi:hypothetical protein